MFTQKLATHKETAHSSGVHKGIYDFLKKHPIGVLATVDPNANPHAAVIYYSIDEDFNITFTTKSATKKSDNLRHNNHVMLIVYEALSQSTVQITAVANELTDDRLVQEAFQNTIEASIETSEAGTPPISKLYAGRYVAYTLKPVQVRAAMFKRPEPGGYDIFETIDF